MAETSVEAYAEKWVDCKSLHYNWQLPCYWPTNIFEHDFHISFHPTHATLSRLIPILQVSQVSPVFSATRQTQPQALAAFFPPPPRPAQQRRQQCHWRRRLQRGGDLTLRCRENPVAQAMVDRF